MPESLAGAPEGVIVHVKKKVQDLIIALRCSPGKERNACLSLIQCALSDTKSLPGSADIILGDLACNVCECGKVVAALAPLLSSGGGSSSGIIMISVIGTAIELEAMGQIRASGAKSVALVHLFANKKQERILLVCF